MAQALGDRHQEPNPKIKETAFDMSADLLPGRQCQSQTKDFENRFRFNQIGFRSNESSYTRTLPLSSIYSSETQPARWNSSNYVGFLFSKEGGSIAIAQSTELTHSVLSPPRQPHTLPNTPGRNRLDLSNRNGAELRPQRETASGCCSAQVFDADRHRNPLRKRDSRGSKFDA